MGCCEGRSKTPGESVRKIQQFKTPGKNIWEDPMNMEIEEYVGSIRYSADWFHQYSESDLQIESLAGSVFNATVPVYRLTIRIDKELSPHTIYQALYDSSLRMKWDDIISEMEVNKKGSQEICYRKLNCMGFSRDFYEQHEVKLDSDCLKVIAYSIDGKNDKKCSRANTIFAYTEVYNGIFETIVQSDLRSSIQNIPALMTYGIKLWKNKLKKHFRRIDNH